MSASEELSACECPVCFSMLTGGRIPMSLPCGHTLCKICVAQLTGQSSSTFHCPICRKLIKAGSVSLNVTLRTLIEELLSRSEREKHGTRSTLNIPYNEVEFGRALDRGAFGEVYYGVWRGNEVAIKVFASGHITDEALLAFRREVFVMNCLRHPNVVLMMGACQDLPKLAILMEYVPGGSLYKLLHVDRVILTLEGVCQVGGDICRGLQYLHSINIVHRDLKSKNVLLTATPPVCQAKLCDFGMARMRLESATMTGNVGTVHWTAPEVMANQRYQFPADVYSLGMVVYEMVTGLVPFHELLPVAVMMAVAINKQQPVIPAATPRAVAALIHQCVCWEPKDRPSIADILGSLMELLPPSTHSQLSHEQSDFVHSDSVSDSADVGVELQTPFNKGVEHSGKGQELQSQGVELGNDSKFAEQLQLEAVESQVVQDAHLAQQLQLKENSYRTPSDLVPRPAKKLMATSFLKQKAKKKAPFRIAEPPVTPLPPPPPPPPPPLLHVAQKNEHHRLQLMNHVRHYAGHVRHKLRPVQSVEKRAFRIGRVVDGPSSEVSQFTFQNLISNFNKRHLNPVLVPEPPAAFPVGVLSVKRDKVKRMASAISDGRIRLPDAVKFDLTHFHKGSLQQVTTEVKNRLPSKEDIQGEKTTQSRDDVDGFW